MEIEIKQEADAVPLKTADESDNDVDDDDHIADPMEDTAEPDEEAVTSSGIIHK